MTTVIKSIQNCAHEHPSSVAVGVVITLLSAYFLIACKSAVATILNFDIKEQISSATCPSGAFPTSESPVPGPSLPVCKPSTSSQQNLASGCAARGMHFTVFSLT
jgi:hypothetical protein